MKIKLCNRCNESFTTYSTKDLLCKKCLSEIGTKYFINGEILTPKQMDNVEEIDQLSEFMEEDYGKCKREIY